MNPVTLSPFVFYLFSSFIFLLMCYSAVMTIIYFWRNFKDVVIFTDSQNRWDIKYINTKGLDEINYKGGTYILNGHFTAPLNKSGKALFKFSENNPEPESLTHTPAKEIDSKTIMAIINNKLVQLLMSLQSNFMNLQYIMLLASCVSAIASILSVLKLFGVIK